MYSQHFNSNDDSDDATILDTETESEYEETHPEWVDGEYVDDIADWEDDQQYIECIHDQYYIGTYKYLKMQDILLFAKKIHLSTFYKYSQKQLSEYLYWYSGIYLSVNPQLEILQINISTQGIYSCIIKTFWIRIIQRRWKLVFHKEKSFYRNNILAILDKRGKTGYSPVKSKLQGLLSHLSKVSK